MIPQAWIEALCYERLPEAFDGQLPEGSVDQWRAELSMAWPDCQQAGLMIKLGLKACTANLEHVPEIADFIAEANDAVRYDQNAQAMLGSLITSREATGSPLSHLADLLNTLEAVSPVAKRERAEIERILTGKGSTLTREQHLARLEGMD